MADGATELLQPPHWLTEIAAVITRLRPELAPDAIDLLDAMHVGVADDIAVLRRASRLAIALQHHLFDTYYHAVALERNAMLITADERYLLKARRHGHIVGLGEWAPENGE